MMDPCTEKRFFFAVSLLVSNCGPETVVFSSRVGGAVLLSFTKNVWPLSPLNARVNTGMLITCFVLQACLY